MCKATKARELEKLVPEPPRTCSEDTDPRPHPLKPRPPNLFSRERERRVLVVYVFRWGRVVGPGHGAGAVPERCRRIKIFENY